MKKKNSASSDVIWRFKKIICQNRINKISQNVAKMLKKICLKNNIIRNKIWSIKVVKKYLFSNEKKIQPDLTSFDPSKKLSAKIALKLYFRKNWGTKSVFSHYVHKLVRKSTFHILYIKLYINLFKIHCFWFFNKILYWNSVGIEFKQWFILLSNKKLNSKEGHVHLSLIDEIIRRSSFDQGHSTLY